MPRLPPYSRKSCWPLGQTLHYARSAASESFQALMDAVRAFRQANCSQPNTNN